MTTKLVAVTALFVLILAGAVALIVIPAPKHPESPAPVVTNTPTTPATSTSPLSDLIVVESVKAGDVVSSPLKVSGQARGTWYFEASFPIELRDSSGKILFQGPAQAQSDWMTTEFVPFSVTLTFPKPTTATGTLILKKDNPSGDPAKDQQLEIPVKFK